MTLLTPLIAYYFLLLFMYFILVVIGLSMVGIMPSPELLTNIYNSASAGRFDFLATQIIPWGLRIAFVLSIINAAYRNITKKKRVLKDALVKSTLVISVLWAMAVLIFTISAGSGFSEGVIFFLLLTIPNLILNAIYITLDFYLDRIFEKNSKR